MFEKVLGSTVDILKSQTCTCASCDCTGSGSTGNTATNQSSASQHATVKGNSK